MGFLNKIIIYGLALVLTANFLLVSPPAKAQTSGDYPPANFSADYSTTNFDYSDLVVSFTWTLPATSPTQYTESGGGKLTTDKLNWYLNFYMGSKEAGKGEHNSQANPWSGGYNKLSWTGNISSDYWGKDWNATLQLRIIEGPDAGKNIGTAFLSGTFTKPEPITGTPDNSTKCPVQNIKVTYYNNPDAGADFMYNLNVNWTKNPKPECSDKKYVDILKPNEKRLPGSDSTYGVDIAPVIVEEATKGVYTIYTLDDNHNVWGKATFTVTGFAKSGTSTKDPKHSGIEDTTAANKTGIGGACAAKCGPIPILNAFCNAQCALIDWLSAGIAYVINHVLFPALGLCPTGEASNPGTPTEIKNPKDGCENPDHSNDGGASKTSGYLWNEKILIFKNET